MIRTRAQESRAAIEKLYISMRHLFNRGSYKPMGISGKAILESLKVLSPEIYGLMNDEEKLELDGLLYVLERLPRGIEECRFIRLISREGYEDAGLEILVPTKRRRNCYRMDAEQMYVEMTRGRSDIYDILTHLSFLYIESEKIRKNSTDYKNRPGYDWQMLEKIVAHEALGESFDEESACSYLSHIIGRTFDETHKAIARFRQAGNLSLYRIVYWMGKLSIEELLQEKDREIFFSATLRERIGHHVYGELWANNIKVLLHSKNYINRPIHIISANLHSVTSCIYGTQCFDIKSFDELEQLAQAISSGSAPKKQAEILNYALHHGLIEIPDTSGTNIGTQLIDCSKFSENFLGPEIKINPCEDLILVMDYAFGEQAFECMDELLKPFKKQQINVVSVSIMGKAGILKGGKGDIMVPNAHVFEGTADNYPFDNVLTAKNFEGFGLKVFEGPMISVLGTSLQNKEVLRYFMESSWNAIGLEMEGAHYQKAIQAASRIRHSINAEVQTAYAYYASDNPLETGSTLASGSLGKEGVKPTYLITWKILQHLPISKKL
jgi:hypothetical protein